MKYLDNEGNIYTTMKYQNKEGISLNYTSDDIHTRLVKEVISKAVTMLEGSITTSPLTEGGRVTDTIDFLKENFDIGDKNNGS